MSAGRKKHYKKMLTSFSINKNRQKKSPNSYDLLMYFITMYSFKPHFIVLQEAVK